MRRPFRFFLFVPCLAMAGILGAGCNYSRDDGMDAPTGLLQPGVPLTPSSPTKSSGVSSASTSSSKAPSEEVTAEKTAILDNVIKLIQTASIKPGGQNFGFAIKNLNQYFEGTNPSDYLLDEKARDYLNEATFAKERIDDLETRRWTMPDARHVEDCMMYNGIATRVAGVGDNLTRVRRVFDWMVRQIQLVPAGTLGTPQLGQAYSRPYDVLVRGMATVEVGVWAERSWLFLSLCRQLGLDGALIYHTPPDAKGPVVWCTAILIDEKVGDSVVTLPYLFDCRIGLPVPDAKGNGVATLNDAMTDPAILARLDLPGQSPYGVDRAALVASTTKIGVLLDSSPRYFAPRMKLLQRSLTGKNLTVLYRSPAEQRDHWVKALGTDAGPMLLWELPIRVETLLFGDPAFMAATKQALQLFTPELPLLFARMKELRGETMEAVQDYVSFRFAVNAVAMDKKTLIPQEVQLALDIYSTYFLGMCQLDKKDPAKATFFFEKTLQMLPEYGPGQPYFTMFRRGASANLGRLMEAKGDFLKASAYYAMADPTRQHHGNLYLARELVWRDPMAPTPAPLPPAPKTPPNLGGVPPKPEVEAAAK